MEAIGLDGPRPVHSLAPVSCCYLWPARVWAPLNIAYYISAALHSHYKRLNFRRHLKCAVGRYTLPVLAGSRPVFTVRQCGCTHFCSLCLHTFPLHLQSRGWPRVFIYYFTSAAVAVDSSQSSPTSSSRFSPPSDFVNGPVSTLWFIVCRWPQSQGGGWPLILSN